MPYIITMFARIIEEQNRINQVNYLADWAKRNNTRKINAIRKEAEAHFRISTNTAYNRTRKARQTS